MRITLITTPGNEVQRVLETRFGATVIDSTMKHRECLEAIRCLASDVLITYRCRHILPDDIIDNVLLAANIHPSLLPAYAGLNPWHEMEKAQETKGGVTIHRLSSQPDMGEVIMQSSLALDFTRPMEWNRHNADVLAANIISKTLKSITKWIKQ